MKCLFAKPLHGDEPSAQEKKALDDLISLLEDQENNDLLDRIDIEPLLAEQITPTTSGILDKSNLKNKSKRFPSPNLNSNLKDFLAMITMEIQNCKQSPLLVMYQIGIRNHWKNSVISTSLQ